MGTVRSIGTACILLVVAGCGRIEFAPVSDASAVDAEIPDPSLVLHVTFDDGIVADAARAHPLLAPVTVPTDTGPVGTSGVYSGSVAECARFADSMDLKPDKFTAAVWVRLTLQATGATAFGRPFRHVTTGANTWEIYARANGFEIGGGGNATYGTIAAVSDTEWHHVAMSHDGTQMAQYFDGSLVATLPVGTVILDDDFITVGCDVDLDNIEFRWLGALDDARLYERALSATEIAVLATPR